MHLIVGLGATGLSCARYLKTRGEAFAVMDTREQPPNLQEFKARFPDVTLSLGSWNESLLSQAAKIILSPGIAVREPAIARQIKQGKPVIGDIELFAQTIKSPVIAITGTNAKSTVTTLVGKMAEKAGYHVQVGGNLGVPALDLLLPKQAKNLYVLELSSFQLETTYSLAPQVATILNITPDHMDRYDTLTDYQRAKLRVYYHCHTAVCNYDDPLTDCVSKKDKYYFTLNTPQKNQFGLLTKNRVTHLAYEDELLLPVKEIPVMGKHYHANVLAALAVGHGFGLPFEPMLEVLREFKGLPHRCQLIRDRNGVKWYNDSKGTNVGATLAAIQGLGSDIAGKIILIAGGLGKNADFTPLLPAIEKYARHLVFIGAAANEMASILGKRIPHSFAADMNEAIMHADQAAQSNDCVLLSPACASFDMYKNFEHRGDVFASLVQQLK